MSEQLTILYERGADGWWLATIPEVPGAFSQGKSRAEARDSVLDAMKELMIARRELALSESVAPADSDKLNMQLNPA